MLRASPPWRCPIFFCHDLAICGRTAQNRDRVLGFCLVYATNISVAQMWFPQHIRGEVTAASLAQPVSGVITSLVVSGYGFGSLIWIPMETAFVNPDNLAPGEEGYYVDEDLLAR